MRPRVWIVFAIVLSVCMPSAVCSAQTDTVLPQGVKAVWDLAKAYRESTSQPHFGQYDWDAEDADRTNGYARHAAFYVHAAQNHPAVVMYSMSHNGTGYSEDMNPDLIDGIHDVRNEWSRRNANKAVRAEVIVRSLDPSRIVYHHSSGNLGSMHTCNFYPNWVPIQEMSDWFGHWAKEGVKPFFSCEYGAPFMWDWGMYRGWYKGNRTFGSGVVPWDFCLAEWNAQFLGDQAFRISAEEKANLRWEAKQFRAGNLWHRWDYPHQLGSRDFDERYPVLAAYLTDNWRAFRTWGVSAISPWEHGVFWKLRTGKERNRRVELTTDWERLQRPGLSPDYLEERYERMDLAYEPTDWIATPAAKAMYRNNRSLLAYIAGEPGRITSKDHNFVCDETVEKQIVVINNSRESVTARCAWSLSLPVVVTGRTQVTVAAGQQERIALRLPLPATLAPKTYMLRAAVEFSTGETQVDRFAIHVVPTLPANRSDDASTVAKPTAGTTKIALFDPKGETRQLLAAMGVSCQNVPANVDLSEYDVLIVGKAALTPEGAAPDITRVRDGLKVIVFEQTAEALEKRLGFRVQEYGLRNVFRRVPDHPYLSGLDDHHLRDWRGAATILPPRLNYAPNDKYNGVPVIRWCGLEVPRLWRCGNRDPRELPLVAGGAKVVANGVLAQADDANVVFCQLAPYDFIKTPGKVPGVTVSAEDAVDGKQSILLTLGTVPWIQFGQKVAAGQVGKTYTCAVSVKALGQPVIVRLEVERAGKPWDRVVRGEDIELPADQWTALYVTFKVNQPYPEGWSAYLHCGQAEARLRVDGFQLFEGKSVPPTLDAGNRTVAETENLFTNSSFEAGTEPWFFTWKTEQQNLRKTFRRSAFLVTRLLANMGVHAQTPLLSRFATPASGALGKSVIKNGDFREDENSDGMPDHWQMSSNLKQATCTVAQPAVAGPARVQPNRKRRPDSAESLAASATAASATIQITCPELDEHGKGSVMLAQGDVPVEALQWYVISLKAKTDRPEGIRVDLALQNTKTWRSLFDYQHFTPGEAWKEFVFLVQANATHPRRLDSRSGMARRGRYACPIFAWHPAIRPHKADGPAACIY